MSLDNRPENTAPVRTLDDLLPYFHHAERPVHAHKVGIEHEKTGIRAGSGAPIPYEGKDGIRELLLRSQRYGYALFDDHGNPIAGTRPGGETLSLEPGGQVELSGRPFFTAREAAVEHARHVARLKALGAELGIQFLAVGYRPFGSIGDMPWMPKTRYAVMREYLPTRGSLALDMMLMTGTVQTSLDFASEADCAAKVRAAASVSPLVAALYANSPVVAGKDVGMQTFRYRVWRDVDDSRAGLLAMFSDAEGFSYRRYAEWAIAAPMIFVRRNGEYVPMRNKTFADFMKDGLDGERATFADFEDHMTTLFPEIRVKTVIEMRSADAVDVETSNALPALFRGLLYDKAAREDAVRLTAKLTHADRLKLQEDCARDGLAARLDGRRTVKDGVRELLTIARKGLLALGAPDDAALLAPLEQIAETGRTHADRAREAFLRGGAAALYDVLRM